jgi:hypothetical protein
MISKSATLVLAGVLLVAMQDSAAVEANADKALTTTVQELDTKMFDSFNRCELDVHREFLSPTMEFYHDNGGATFDREKYLGDVRKNICGKVMRKLLHDTLKVYPIASFGAIAEGAHIFCRVATGKCEGAAKFMVIWERKGDSWKASRIASYAHRELSLAEKIRYSAPVK